MLPTHQQKIIILTHVISNHLKIKSIKMLKLLGCTSWTEFEPHSSICIYKFLVIIIILSIYKINWFNLLKRFFWQKISNIRSFKLIEYIDTIQI